MAWIESHQTLLRHPKTGKALRLLGVSRMAMLGHLHCLWWWCLDFADDGNLSALSDAEIAEGGQWEGEPGAFVHALTEAGFLDPDRMVHDWWDYAGKLVQRRQDNARRQREWRDRQKSPGGERDERATSPSPNGDGDGDGAPPNAHVTVTSQPRHRATVPNPTQPDRTQQGANATRAPDAPARERARGRDLPAIIPLREGAAMPEAWYDRTFRQFVRDYPKGVPGALRDRWPPLCPDEATWAAIAEGLGHWCECRQWKADGNDYVTKPERWLVERMYLEHPRPWSTDGPAPEPPPAPRPPSYDERREEERERTSRAVASLFTPLGQGDTRPALEAGYTVRRAAGAPGGGQ